MSDETNEPEPRHEDGDEHRGGSADAPAGATPGPADGPRPNEPRSDASAPLPPGPAPLEPPPRELDPASNAWGMACHLSTLTTFLLAFGVVNVPGLIAPLILWQVLENAHPSAVFHAKEAFNFQLHVLVAMGLCLVLSSCCVGIPLLLLVNAANIGFTLYAAARAANGERWEYPAVYRVLS